MAYSSSKGRNGSETPCADGGGAGASREQGHGDADGEAMEEVGCWRRREQGRCLGLGVALGKRSSSGDGYGVEEARRDGSGSGIRR